MKYLKLYESYYDQEFYYCFNMKLKNLDIIKRLKHPEKVKFFFCSNNDLENLNGIAIFKNVEFIECHTNKIRNLNGIEKLHKFKRLDCRSNNLHSLKDILNKNIEVLYCGNNEFQNLDGIEKFKNFTFFDPSPNPWVEPLPIELVNKFYIRYTKLQINVFSQYEYQKYFLTKYPERFQDLTPFDINEKIKEEFPDLIEGSEFGFFNLR